ncbi:UDP-glucose pyrophosphorylase [Frankia sp. EI5c]|uniref:UTP--glucose-1-phosphate uridylyltransferase n=1 Tax=Frankia sp. EI5c TaxID=683316 RepID=UPI0007C35782|nr:UTP--glucose-1-phosphate uridylyltransferase [Frankia sp. EI5c]OAA25194.1 UDP-glucose pyrophosphorylase [Frankia sp. EI5c]
MLVTKAVIPAAGLGTRFLPATKSVPKEMLPVVDRPAIEYVVEEASQAGLRDVLLVTSRSKKAIEDHFDREAEVEAALERKGDKTRLERVRASAELAEVHSVRQSSPRGLGHAVLCAAAHVGSESFAVLLGDDLIDERDPLLVEMIALQARHGGAVVALMEVPEESVSMYGVATIAPGPPAGAAAEPAGGAAALTTPTGRYRAVRVTDLVEKPPVDEAPSNLAVIGRYVLPPEIFDILRSTPPGRGGEIQLTDALRTLAERAGDDPAAALPVHGIVFTGRRYDTGDRVDYLKAIVRLASERPDLGPEFYPWLEEYVASGGPKAEA